MFIFPERIINVYFKGLNSHDVIGWSTRFTDLYKIFPVEYDVTGWYSNGCLKHQKSKDISIEYYQYIGLKIHVYT